LFFFSFSYVIANILSVSTFCFCFFWRTVC